MVTAAVAAMALSAIVASTASATIVAAKFSPSGQVKLTTTSITVKRNGTEAKVCTPSPNNISGAAENSSYFIANNGFGETKFSCPSGAYFSEYFSGQAKYDTVTEKYYWEMAKPYTSLTSPWGSYFQVVFKVDWVNGSGLTPSTLVFKNQTVGVTSAGASISVEGTYNVTTTTGGLVTLTH